MIPVKLTMRNFMCYRGDVPPLFFDGLHTACISGDNGNGKSALIDAMTWALWGETRAKSDDDLIYQGQPEMEVELDFAVGQQLYRIIRKRTRRKRQRASGQSILEFQIATENGFRSITGNSMSETQRKIVDTLHMNYETFKNSAFLRQGHADEFTVKQPAQRKQVLADILGLFFYDDLEERAKEFVKQEEIEVVQLERAIKDIADELAQKPIYEARVVQAQSELSQIEGAVKEQESNLSRLREEKELLESKNTQLAQLEERIAETKRGIEQWDEQAGQHRSRIKEYEELIAQRPVIEQGYARFVEAKKLCDELDQEFRQLAVFDNRKHQMEMAVERAQAAIITEHKLAQSRIEDLEARSQKLGQLKDELRQAEAQLHQLSEQEETLRRKRQTLQELQAQVNYLESDRVRLEQEIADIEEKLKLLLSQHEAKCPLCETELGIDGIKLIETKYAADRDQKSDSLRSSQTELAGKMAGVESLQGETSRLEQQLNQDKTSVQGRASSLSQEIAEAEKASSQLNQGRQVVAEIEQRLASKDFASAEQQALAELEGEIARIGYDSQQHEQARHRLTELEQYENSKLRLEEADRLIGQEKEVASKAEEAAEELRHRLDTEGQKRQELTIDPNVLLQVVSDLDQSQAEYQSLTARQKEAQETLGSVKAMLERCSEQEGKKKDKEKQLSLASKEGGIYRELVQAFGKRGIQAMLIETALPEIETEANKLLARMTDNRMHLKFETQRETKKGDSLETLDITISDELGMRNYEMFSGGEAFRVDFAIRIALSKLLARRVGAPLRTLIIDEGFGTQDSSGIEKIKEAINSIQDDFDKTLVITHIEELRDAFPTRIDVIKTSEGSTIEMSSA
ncbi:AAA family ATPase [Chloroflexota bacterium]